MTKTYNVLIFAAVVSGAVSCALAAEPSAPAAPELRPALVTTISFAPDNETHSLVVSIRPRVEVDQAFRVTGKVARRLVDVGARVKAGDGLAVLDENDFNLQKEQAEAEFAAATRIFEQATADEARGRQLFEKGWNSIAAYDKQRSALEEARGRMRRAERSVSLAQNALTYATLKADADGAITAALCEPGQVLAAGQPAFRLARAGEKEAQAAIPETLVNEIGAGLGTLAMWSRPDKTYHVRLREMAPSADPASRTFAARFTILDADDAIALGMSATLKLDGDGKHKVARVPLSALFNQGGGPVVWTVGADGSLQMKPVAVERYEGKFAVLSSGVQDGDKVVVVGVHKLDASVKVQPVTQISF